MRNWLFLLFSPRRLAALFTLHSGGGGGAPAADPKVGEAALTQAQTGQQFLDFMKGQYNDQKPMLDKLNDLGFQIGSEQLSQAKTQAARSNELFARQKQLYFPLEEKYTAEVADYGGKADQEQQAGNAVADVNAQFDAVDRSRNMSMARYGLNPADYQAAADGVDLARAGAQASGATKARTDARLRGIALREGAVNVGRGTSTASNTAAQLATQSGNAALQAPSAALAGQQAANSAVGQGYQTAMQGYGQSGSLLSNQRGQNISAWAAQEQAAAQESAGWGAGVGALAGAALLAFSSKKLKKDIKPASDEKALAEIRQMPGKTWRYKEGVVDGGAKEHRGPMAEDYTAATGKGDGTAIDVADQVHRVMLAVRALDKRVAKMGGKKVKQDERETAEA